MLRMACSMHLSQRALLRMPRRCTQRDQRNVRQRVMPYVPFVNRPFESKIHVTVNFTYFCCVLLVTWCHRMLLLCYARPK